MSEPAPKRRIGPFELEERLGVGGMGIVYKATYLKTGQTVAVKVLAPDLTADDKVAKRFEREMEILKKLKHPNIIKYYGGSSTAAQRFYAMEIVEGGALDDVLKKRRLSWEETIDYGIQIAKALEHAHAAGIIHRDLKPANLLLADNGVLKLSDFGIARDTQVTALTAAGKTVGTMAYMAPEQITGKSPITRRTDLYALGCVLFEMLTGRPPFQGETQPELLFKHVDEVPPSVRELNMEVPVWLERLISELLEKDPEDRPFDALAVQVKLEEIRKKVTQQESVVHQTLVGGASALTRKEGDPALTKLIGKKKGSKSKSPTDYTPWYEKMWFLGGALALLLGVAVWGLWPKSEARTYEDLKQAIAAAPEQGADVTAYEEDIREFLTRFPETTHAGEAQGWLDDAAVIEADRHATSTAKWNRNPRNEGERLYLEARTYENTGDRVTALTKYRAIHSLFQGHAELKAYSELARRRIAEIEPSGDLQNFVRAQIVDADRLHRDGTPVPARRRWQSLVELYGDKSEFDVLMRAVKARLEDAEAGMSEFPIQLTTPTAKEASVAEE
ncbi:MAG: serine/threonine-protein kinase [Planctomycetaceae bacterium]